MPESLHGTEERANFVLFQTSFVKCTPKEIACDLQKVLQKAERLPFSELLPFVSISSIIPVIIAAKKVEPELCKCTLDGQVRILISQIRD